MRTGMSRWLEDEWNLMKSTLNSSLSRLSAPSWLSNSEAPWLQTHSNRTSGKEKRWGCGARKPERAGPTAGRGAAGSGEPGVTMLRGHGGGVKRRLNRDIQTRTRPHCSGPHKR